MQREDFDKLSQDELFEKVNAIEAELQTAKEHEFSEENLQKIQKALETEKANSEKLQSELEELRTDYNNRFVDKLVDGVKPLEDPEEEPEETPLPTIDDLFTKEG